ncbi:MAG: SpoIIE family protein phosphatase [Leptospirales bacterium]|nr:SpoIIE family protein phosphatase [Leptospirales bacterium]
MRRILYLAILIAIPPLWSAPELQLQTIGDLERETSLDSQDSHTWWATSHDVKPDEEWARTRDSRTDEPSGVWEPVGIPTVSHFQRKQESPRVAWLRKVFVLSKPENENVAIRLGVVTDKDRVYVNGQLIGWSGKWDASTPEAYDKIRIYRIPGGILRAGVNQILIQARGYFPDEVGIQKDHTSIGPADAMFQDFYIYNFREAGFLVLYFTAGSYFLFLFIRRRKERENLLFGLFVWVLVGYQFLRTQFKNILGWDFLFWKQIEYGLLFLLIPLMYYFIRTYFELPRNRIVRLLDIVTAIPAAIQGGLAVFALFSSDMRLLNKLNTNLAQPLWLILVIAMLGIIIYRIVRKDRDAFYMLMGLLVVLGATINDIFSSRTIINTPRLTGYAFIFFIMSLALVLANRFVRLNEEIEDLNKNLEGKVQKRTEELNTTLNAVHALKVQQDGDYFLTSLLLRPLNGIHAVSETVSASMIVEQKKKFVFKKWSADIGGDVVSTYSIELKGRPYTALINADAMGKSMQGAGGALVLGTVFKNVVARSQSQGLLSDRFPEQWMKECFIELQNVFVSFDGSMMISAILGLVDDSTGLFYFINAEHPYTVLYRNRQATFVEREADYLRKIGVQGLDSGLRVGTLQLGPGDAVIMGSDGRDDIAIGVDERGNRIISEDTDAFLKIVEEANGDLEDIVGRIKARGEITDDLSLLRVSFAGTPGSFQAPPEDYKSQIEKARATVGPAALSLFSSAFETWANDANGLIEAAKIAAQQKEWKLAVRFLDLALAAEPGNSETLFQLALAMRQAAQTRKDALNAAEVGERLRLRNPEHLGNLILLAELYRLAGNPERARVYLSRAEGLDASHPGIDRLRSSLGDS